MLARVFLVALSLACLAGCGKAPTTSAIPAQSKPGDPAVAGEDPAVEAPSSAVEPSADPAQLAVVLGELTQVVRKYSVEQRRVPKSFDELVTAGYLARVPEPPAGKRFAISKNLQAYLADR
jgi:hypothetical protein